MPFHWWQNVSEERSGELMEKPEMPEQHDELELPIGSTHEINMLDEKMMKDVKELKEELKYRCPYCVDRNIRPCTHTPETAIGVDGKPLPAPETYKEYGDSR